MKIATELTACMQEKPTRESMLDAYQVVRGFSRRLTEPLTAEDQVVQTMTEVSPTKWHLAHTTWFFEAFILREAIKNYRPYDPEYHYLFNSYYNSVGRQFSRQKRGLLSRPNVEKVWKYRDYIDLQMEEFLDSTADELLKEYLPIIQLGLHHEQQHQELILTDIKHVFAINPLKPVYHEQGMPPSGRKLPLEWIPYPEGLCEVGHGGDGFAYDNEMPRHKVYLNGFLLSSRLITNGEYIEFIEDGGYERPEFWLSDGWNTAIRQRWKAPLYWERRGGDWWMMTIAGMRKVVCEEPVCHVSYYEADAYASWAGARLPTEAEWEVHAGNAPVAGNFVEDGYYHPVPLIGDDAEGVPKQLFGDVWEWTRSAYVPYPGYRALPGALGEYNGKFMSNQQVLRGGSAVTSSTHIRATYRNFFHPWYRWQFMGFRLAKDL
ncbi:MAG: ergothioneine biosynthesis protein EgtB [Candidatus Glassbacteria bacterium]